MIQREVILEGGQPWGFRIHGGAESKTPLRVSKINPGSKASLRGIKENDLLTSINGKNTQNLTNNEAHNLIKESGDFLKLGLNEDSDGTVPKRRQYRTIHHETHQETVKKSSVRYTLKESTENSPLNAELKRKQFQQFKSDEFADDQKDSKVNGQRVAVVRNIPILQNSTSSSSTTSTLVPEGKHDISSEHAIASRQSSYSNCSSIPDEGIWSPGLPHRRPSSPNNKSYQRTESQSSLNQNNNNEPISPIWTPKSTNSSPVIERKEFRSVNFNSPVLNRRNRTKSETIQQSPEFISSSSGQIRKPPEDKSDTAINFSSNFDRKLPNSQSSPLLAQFSTTPRLPRVQNPTVTLLQKAREGQLPRGAHYLDQDRKPPNDRPPIKYPGEVLRQIRNDYTSESDTERTKKMTEISPRKFEGVGPTTKDGMPLILRSEVRNEDQSKWYKRMYDTIHKQKPHRDEYVTIRYKQKRAKYPYSSGYLSEPEPGAYDSDFTEYKYQTLDRRRPTSSQKYLYFNDIPSTTSMSQNIPDRSYSYTDVARNTHEKYDNNQPGRIENYRPGHSSISDKEAKRWWDEVMDIFDGHLQQQQSRRVPPPQNPRSFINQALKESGYESDSTLVFKRKQENAANHLNSTEQKEAYKQIQKGGDVPFQGLRKSVPERPKETDLVEFCPISPTLTKIRIHKSIIPQNDVVVPQQEFFCYPVNVQYNQTKTFANFKRTAPSSIKLNRSTNTPTPPPSPPKRKSSRNNSTLRLISTMKVKTEKSPLYKRHETCFNTSGSNVDKIIYKLSSPSLNKRREISKAGVIKKVNTTPDLKTKILSSTLSTSKDLENSTRKVHSTTGKSRTIYKTNSNGNITKNKSSTESLSSTRTPTPVKNLKTEKKKFSFSLPLIKSNKLSKSPNNELLSPVEVKKGIKNISDSSVHYKKSFAVLPSSKNKTLPIKVGITEKGKNILKKSTLAKNNKKSNNKVSTTESLTTKKDTKISDMKQKCFSKSTDSSEYAQQLEILKKIDPYSNNFFRSLFLQDVNYASIIPQPKTWIMEKTDQLTRQRRSLGECNVGAMKIYLKHTKPVSDSKFLSLDYFTRSRSASPKCVTFNDNIEKRSRSSPSKLIFSQTSRPVSPAISRKKSPILKQTDTNFKRRSPSPPKKFIFTQTSRPVSPIIIRKLSPSSIKHNPVINSPNKLYFSQTVRPISPEIKRKSFQSPPPSPCIARSPSCRRIMQFKEQNKLPSYYQDLNNSTTSLDSFNSEDYHIYLKDCFSPEKNDKFKDLNEFYSDIEKVGELEQKVILRPRKSNENEIIDYDRWMEVRTREKAEHELKHLYNHLKYHEKEKGFLFMPKDVEKVKWKRELDRGLRIKEKSVENLKDSFERLKHEESEREAAKRRELAYSKDTYKPLWRGTSVINLANILTERRSQSEGRVKTTRQKLMETRNIFTHGINPKIWSSLSSEQVTNLKRQLQEIYGDETNSIKEIAQKKFEVEVPQKFIEKNFVPKLTVRRNSESSKHDLMSENEKKVISQTLSKEVLQKIANKRKENKLALPLVIGKEVLGAKATQDTNFNKISAIPIEPLVKTNALQIPTSEAESGSIADGSTDDSTKTVINLQDVQKKVEYFEKAKDLETFIPTVYKAADEETLEEDQPESETIKKTKLLSQSKSYQNLKEYFGETELKKFATLPLSATKKFDYKYIKKPQLRALDISPIRTISEANSIDSFTRSRSASPSSYSEEAQNLLKKGEVRKLRKQFEFFEDFFGEKKLKRSRSENDLKNLTNNVVVEDLRRKYEYPVYSGRGRSRTKRGGMISPVWLKPEDRYMPHINIISKIANLYSFSKNQKSDDNSKSMEELAEILGCPIGEVEKMKDKFDKIRAQEEISLMGHMYTSSPNIKELRDITPYLTANWIAHKYPRIEDNPRSVSSPNTSRNTSVVMRKDRIKSSSPIRKMKRNNVVKQKEITEISSRYTKEPELLPPPPPPPPKSQGGLKSQDQESPRKYVENEVTIHYKTPIRTEIKEYVSEEELAYRQAEIMKKIYENEKKKKYLQELQDMKSRRHTDNFIPSQKSPISLNRYDDFEDLTVPPKPRRRSPEPRLVAKALYNFVGQTAKELTFRKGELIYLRRQIDKNWYEGELNAMIGLFPVNYVEIVPYEGIKIPTNRKAHEGQARAKYNFVAQTHLELSLARGELVTITRKIDDNWFEGKIGGRKGIFPVSYVEVLIDPSEVLPASSKPVAAPAAHSLLLNGSSQGKESMGSHSYTPNIPNPITNRRQLLLENNGFHHAKAVQLSGTGTYSTLPKFKSPSMDQTLHIETQTEPVAYRAIYKYTPQNDDELELLEGDTVYVLEKCDDGWFVGSSNRTGAFGTFPGNYVEKI